VHINNEHNIRKFAEELFFNTSNVYFKQNKLETIRLLSLILLALIAGLSFLVRAAQIAVVSRRERKMFEKI